MAFKGKKMPVHAENSSGSEFVRRFKTNPLLFTGTIVVLVIVVVAFVLVPAIVPNAGQSADLTFGSYDKIPISYVPGNYFAQYYGMLAQYRQNSGDTNYNQFADYELWLAAYQAATVHTAVIQEMKESGYTAPAKLVDREVAKQYQENGRFSTELYEQEDSNSRLARWRRTQDDIAALRFYSDLQGMLKPSAAAAFAGKMAALQRSFDIVSFPVENYPDTELIAYGEENAGLFRLTHLSKITVSSSEREAQQILTSIKDGITTFEESAKTYSKDAYAEKGGDMGIKAAHELVVEIPEEAAREKVIALKKGEYSDVIQVNAQWVFFRAEDDTKNEDTSDAAAIGRIRSYVQSFERGRMENWAIDQAKEFAAIVEKDGFESALGQKGIAKRSFGPIALNYGNVDLLNSSLPDTIPELYSSASDETFWKTAFSTPVNSPSEPLVQGGNVLVLFPSSETEAEEAAVESIESVYSTYWLTNSLELSLRSYIMTSDKMEDRFMETFLRYLMPQNG
ncbi:MAG TPA: peptidylprolyl isomerase [Treponema sp.]|nr:peptidylprolyl isomerase [Treponema sp.]